jgi:hypothetical protein
MVTVIDFGQPLLNIEFPDEVKAAIVEGCQGNVGLLQEVCFRLCERYEVWQTGDALRTVGKPGDVDDILRALSDEHASRYRNFLYRFAQGLGETQHEMYKWLLWAVIKATPNERKSGCERMCSFRASRTNIRQEIRFSRTMCYRPWSAFRKFTSSTSCNPSFSTTATMNS